jgi:hypothetical protein
MTFRSKPRAKRPKVLHPTEHQIQKAFFDWLALAYPGANLVTWATPNAARRSYQMAAVMKAEGLRSGVPDVFMAVPRGQSHGLFLEFKSHAGRLTANQVDFCANLVGMGYQVLVVRSLDEARLAVTRYMEMPCES